MSIGGRCRCNGHAFLCDITDPTDSYKLICRCQHNTCGHNCEMCCPGFEQKAWSQSKYDKLFECERKILQRIFDVIIIISGVTNYEHIFYMQFFSSFRENFFEKFQLYHALINYHYFISSVYELYILLF